LDGRTRVAIDQQHENFMGAKGLFVKDITMNTSKKGKQQV